MYLWEQGTTPTAFPALKEDRHTEVLVVGGGMAGILCAYMLQQKGIECVLVEAETVGSGVTRGTTAVLTAQHDFLYKDMVNKFGADKSRRYLRANL